MECIIPVPNIKVFASAIHSLAKIGEELYVDPSKDGFAIQTVNSSKSSFASYTFKPSFFSACLHQSKTNSNSSRAGVVIPASQQISTPMNIDALNCGIGDVLAEQEAVKSPGKFWSVASRTVLPDGGIKSTFSRKKKPLRETFHPARQGRVCRRVASEVGISAKRLQNIMTSTPCPMCGIDLKRLCKKSSSPNEITTQIEQKIEDNTEETCFQGHSNVKYRVTMRGIIIAFKSISELEKTTEACILTFCDKTSKLKICIICKFSIIKTYTLPFVESVSPMAIYDQNVMANRFVAKAKTLTGAVLFEAVTFDAAFQPSDICDTDVIVTSDDDDLTSDDGDMTSDDDLTSDDDDLTSDIEKID